MNFIDTLSPREAAFLALCLQEKEQKFLADSLDHWQRVKKPKSADFQLAREIAYGTCRMALCLDAIAKKLTSKGRLDLKKEQKILLRTAIYQFVYLDRIPLHAICNETIKIAKKHFHPSVARFFNALLRKLTPEVATLDEALPWATRYSFPEFFVDQLTLNYGSDRMLEYLKVLNQAGVAMYREVDSTKVYPLKTDKLKEVAESGKYYIQNCTPVELFCFLTESNNILPHNILDLCASPGGKLLLAHHFFKQADLFANDISEQKLKTLKQNCEKYELSVNFSCGKGEEFSSDQRFDLIIIDAPCSNSGVLNKRPEARWRLNQESLSSLEETQLSLIKQAVKYLTPKGQIWYMTCSILSQENEQLVQKASNLFNLKVRKVKTIFPGLKGSDGGFAAVLILGE